MLAILFFSHLWVVFLFLLAVLLLVGEICAGLNKLLGLALGTVSVLTQYAVLPVLYDEVPYCTL